MNLRGHTNEEILSGIRGLIGSQRELTAQLIVYLAEIEHRRLHLLAGFSSMFEFCVKELRLSEGEAFRRLTAARLGRKFPMIRCRSHNRLWAEQTFGQAHIARALHFRQRKCATTTNEERKRNQALNST